MPAEDTIIASLKHLRQNNQVTRMAILIKTRTTIEHCLYTLTIWMCHKSELKLEQKKTFFKATFFDLGTFVVV